MPNTFKIYEDLQDSFSEQQAKTLTKVISQVIIDESNIVTKVEFNDLKEIVAGLAVTVKELAEAQKRTEARVEELAEAQKKTEETVRRLVVDVSDVKKQLGGLSMAVGYGIEDKYIPIMENFALNRYGADIDIVERKHIIYPDGKYDEINLYLEGNIKGKKIYIIGESKAQPGKKDLDRFNLMLGRLKDYFKVKDDGIKGFMIGYIFAPEVENYARFKYPHIDLFKTYQIERIGNSGKTKNLS
jgi:hypothetical protein